MTDKLYCPFCGTELEKFGGGDFPMMHYCDNTNCKLYHIMGQYTLWQALIDGKEAQDALLFISNIRGAGMSYQDMFLDAQAIAKYVSGRTTDLILVGRYTQDELNEITSITKQKK